jgi:hypothetical protein
MYPYSIDGLVERKKIDEIGTEGVFRGETDFESLGLDKIDHFNRSLRDICHVLSVRMFSEKARRPNNHIKAVNTSLYSQSSVVHVASDI